MWSRWSRILSRLSRASSLDWRKTSTLSADVCEEMSVTKRLRGPGLLLLRLRRVLDRQFGMLRPLVHRPVIHTRVVPEVPRDGVEGARLLADEAVAHHAVARFDPGGGEHLAEFRLGLEFGGGVVDEVVVENVRGAFDVARA